MKGSVLYISDLSSTDRPHERSVYVLVGTKIVVLVKVG